MIISASRRTDIPAFYSDWFFNRLKQGFVLVRNPMNSKQISKISLSPKVVDCIVFWTKNPAKMLDKLSLLNAYNYYFQFTITPYDVELEPNLPNKSELMEIFTSLSKRLGKQRVIWRYDPIIFSSKYTLDYHLLCFKRIASTLSSYTRKCVISFIDLYKKTKKNLSGIDLIPLSEGQMRDIACAFSNVAGDVDIEIVTCSEEIDLKNFGISHGKCIDDKLITEISGYELDLSKDKTQRPECGCIASIDIGAYNTCSHGCLYCYANFNSNEVKKNVSMHDPKSALLFGNVCSNDQITERKVVSCKILQQRLFKEP
jgi:hypothetical protein